MITAMLTGAETVASYTIVASLTPIVALAMARGYPGGMKCRTEIKKVWYDVEKVDQSDKTEISSNNARCTVPEHFLFFAMLKRPPISRIN